MTAQPIRGPRRPATLSALFDVEAITVEMRQSETWAIDTSFAIIERIKPMKLRKGRWNDVFNCRLS